MSDKVLTAVHVGSTRVYELVRTQKRPSVVLRSTDHSGERITIINSAIPGLVQALGKIHEVFVPRSAAQGMGANASKTAGFGTETAK